MKRVLGFVAGLLLLLSPIGLHADPRNIVVDDAVVSSSAPLPVFNSALTDATDADTGLYIKPATGAIFTITGDVGVDTDINVVNTVNVTLTDVVVYDTQLEQFKFTGDDLKIEDVTLTDTTIQATALDIRALTSTDVVSIHETSFDVGTVTTLPAITGAVTISGTVDATLQPATKRTYIGDVVQHLVELTNCDTSGGWTGSTDVSNITQYTTAYRDGTASLQFDKDGTTQTYGQVQKTITSIDAETVGLAHASLRYWLYVSATTNISSVYFACGTDSSNYFYWETDNSELSAGWQHVHHYWGDIDGQVGEPDISAVTWVAMRVNFDATGNQLNDICIDGINVKTMAGTTVEDVHAVGYAQTVRLGDGTLELDLGTAGSSATSVISIQGVGGGTAVPVSGAVTISGVSTSANQTTGNAYLYKLSECVDTDTEVKVTLDGEGVAVTNQALTDAIGSDSGVYIRKAKTPTIYNVTMTTEDIEYSQALPARCLRFLIQCRTAFDMKLAFTASGTYSTYMTIPADSTYSEDNLSLTDITLYFQCGTAAKVVEITAWQ